MSNVVPLFPPGLNVINDVFPLVDELADSMFKTHGLEEAGFSLVIAWKIANEIVERKGFAPISSQSFDFTMTLINAIRFRLATRVLQLNHLSELYDLAELAAEHNLLPTEEEWDAQPPPEDWPQSG